MPRRDVILTFLLVVAIGTLWGLNWPVIKLILTELPPLTVRAVAFPCATLLLIALALATGARLLPTRSEFAQLLLTGLFLVFGFNVLTTFGQLHTDASRAVLIAYTMPAMTAALAVVFLGERMHWPVALALAIGTLGIALLVLDDLSAVSSQLRGSTIMLLAALSWSIGNVLLKSRDWSISPLVLTTWCFGFSTLLAWPLVAIFEPLHEQLWPSGKTYWLLIYHAAAHQRHRGCDFHADRTVSGFQLVRVDSGRIDQQPRADRTGADRGLNIHCPAAGSRN